MSQHKFIHLESNISQNLKNEVEKLVYTKYLIDKFIHKYGRRYLFGGLGGSTSPLCGFSFFSYVFPFTNKSYPMIDGKVSAYVPIKQTFGHSWKRGESDWKILTKEQSQKYLSQLKNLEHVQNKISENSHIWIQALGLFLPHEGKNRIDFFRYRGEECIPVADVSPYSYPDPQDMVIYNVNNTHGQPISFAILNNEEIELLDFPDLAIPVLEAYGVKVLDKWKQDDIEINVITNALKKHQNTNQLRSEKSILLSNLKKTDELEKEQNEQVQCSIANLDNNIIKLDWKSCLKDASLFIVVAAIVLILYRFKFPFFLVDVYVPVLYILLGTMIGFVFACERKMFFTKRKYTNIRKKSGIK